MAPVMGDLTRKCSNSQTPCASSGEMASVQYARRQGVDTELVKNAEVHGSCNSADVNVIDKISCRALNKEQG